VTVDTWVVVGDNPGISNLMTIARSLGGSVSAAVAGPQSLADIVATSGVGRVVWFGEPADAPVEAYATLVADAVKGATGVLLGGRHPSERVLLGAAAASLQAPVLTEPLSISVEGSDVVVTHSVFGGIAEETVSIRGPVAIMVDGGPIPLAGGSSPVEEITGTPLAMRVTGTKPSSFEEVDLGSAPRVIGIGRGLKTEADLAMIEALAKAAGAEIACSRPLAEGLNWLGKDRYIGISGQHIAPKLYLAIGISGQLQHMAGVREAETIVAINSDPDALVFKDADYCLVGDLYEIVPAITRVLK
jgi:electron transfer flavoprotein alpha subunit